MGGELIQQTADVYGLKRFATGMVAPLTPKWSHDGRWIAFMRRDNGENRLHIVSTETWQSKDFSRSGADVVEFEWGAGSPTLTVTFVDHESSELDRYRMRDARAIDTTPRFWMIATTEPFEVGPIETRQFQLDLSHFEKWQDARFAEIDLGTTTISQPANSVWIEVDPMPVGAYHTRVHARNAGEEIACEFKICEGATAAWAQRDTG